MNRIRISFIILAALAILSCKKKEEQALPSLSGSLKINGIEAFISADAESRTITLKPSGAEHPEGKKLGYYWKVSPTMTKYDTTRYENGLNKAGEPSDGSFTHTIKDSLGTYTIYCYAFASGYNGMSAAGYITVVRGGIQASPDDPATSITNTKITEKGSKLAGTDYYYITLEDGTQDWLANNIADKSKGVGFRGYDAMSGVFGRYYSYDEAKEVCSALPANGGNAWRLPTDEDWVKLIKDITTDADGEFKAEAHRDIYWDNDVNGKPSLTSRLIADGYFNGEKLWEFWPEVGLPANTSGMAILPCGYANLGITPELKSKSAYPAALFEGIYEFAAFWTADEVSDNTDMAYYRSLFLKEPHLMIGKGYKSTFGASVRCVRESN
jgi:uncharacterized protein (TIGR02145 family)